MKLLILSNNISRASFRQRVDQFVPRLERGGIDCSVQQLPKPFWARRRIFQQAKDFDGVLLHKKTLTHFDARTLRRQAQVLIYDFDDAIMYSARRPEKAWSSHFSRFRQTVGMMDMVIAGNHYLAELAQRFNDNVQVLPTGMDTQAFDLPDKRPDDGKVRLVWIGSKSTLTYLKQLGPVLEQLGRQHPHLVLRIICDAFPNLTEIEVEERIWSLDTQAADLAACDIGLAPLPDNRFTRGKCGFKILQYAAAGLPTVGSPVGVNVDFVGAPQHGLTATTPEQWTEALTHLISDPGLRGDMGRRAQQFSRQFDAAPIGEKFVTIIQKSLRAPTEPGKGN